MQIYQDFFIQIAKFLVFRDLELLKERGGKVGEGKFCPEGRQEVDLEVVWASAQQPVCSWCCRASDVGRMTDRGG